MDNADFYLFWHRAQDEATKAGREADAAQRSARDAESSANDAENAAANAKKSEAGAMEMLKKMYTLFEESKVREDAYLGEIRLLKGQITSMCRSISREKELAEQREKVRRLDEARKDRAPRGETVIECLGTTTTYSLHNRHIG
jgi:chromosome segregation ATPase